MGKHHQNELELDKEESEDYGIRSVAHSQALAFHTKTPWFAPTALLFVFAQSYERMLLNR